MHTIAYLCYSDAMKIGVVGASGYAGGELLRLLAFHPQFKVTAITAHSNAGEQITSIHPHSSTPDEREDCRPWSRLQA